MKNKLENKVGFMGSNIKKAKYALLVAAIPFLASCAVVPYQSTGKPYQRPSQEISVFSYEKELINPSIELKEQRSFYDMYKIQFPSLMKTDPKNDTVTAYYYKPKKGGKSAAIVVFPIMGGSYFASEYFAHHYAKAGFAVLRYERKGKLIDKRAKNVDKLFSKSHKVLQQTIIDARRGIDWLEQQLEVDKDKIGLSGISLGAIVGSLLLESDSRFKAGVLMLGGGNISEILYKSNEKGLRKGRERIYRETGMTPEDLKKKLEECLEDVDPLTYAKFADPSKVLMLNGVFDDVVPFEQSKELWEAMGRPKMIKLPAGHYTAFLFLPYGLAKAKSHFRKTLDYKFKHPEPEPNR